MINAIINGLLTIVMTLLQIIVYPFNLLLTSLFPDASAGIQGASDFLTTVSGTTGWIISWVPLSSLTLSFVALTLIFRMNAAKIVRAIKIGWEWLQKIKFW